jgi:predicted acylesterase/phospholipase RssA
MRYDTLILSGGSIKGIAYLGFFKYLLENDKINIKSLKHIIAASAGAFMSLVLLFNIKIEVLYKIILETEVNIIDKDKFKLENFVNNFGFYDNIVIEKYTKLLIKYFLKRENITLKELYKINKIKFTVKVSNVTKNCVEYINYKNYPHIDLVTLIKMTTSIPIIFKPVKYNDCLYSDGANGGGLPIEYNKSKNYLAVVLYPLKKPELKENANVLDYLTNLLNIHNHINDYNNYLKYKNLIIIDLNIPIKIDTTYEEKIKMFSGGYYITKEFFSKI